jgi:hypothetical protein
MAAAHPGDVRAGPVAHLFLRRERVSGVRTLSALTVTLAIAVVLSVEAAAAAPTKAEFIRRGDALCTQAKGQLVPLHREAESAKALPREKMWSAATRLWTKQLRIQSGFVSRFRSLGVPPNDARARSIVAGMGRGLTLTRRVRDAFAARSTSRLATELQAFLQYTVALNRRVVAYGFVVCGR